MRWALAVLLVLVASRAFVLLEAPAAPERELAQDAGGAVLYQYVDDAGQVRIVESLAAVPPGKRAGAGRIEGTRPAAPPARSHAAAAPRPLAEVEVFTSDACPYCDAQLRDLAAAGIRYRERNIDRDPDAARELARHDRRRPVPTTAVGDRAFVGYDARHVARVRFALEFDASGGDAAQVVLYTQATCGYSRRLMAELDRLGVEYVNRDIDRDPAARARLVALTGRPGVPAATVGGDLLTGWSPDRAREIQARAEPGWSWWPF